MRRKTRLSAACGLVLLIVFTSHATPLSRLRRDAVAYNSTLYYGSQSACTVGDIVYQVGENVPGSSPCEKCTCTGLSKDGTGVNCQSVQCEVKAGCKALHRADHCCPLYQCECTRNGKIYSNGQKLEDPENPCQVCYCQGGEIVCNKIACFVRNDCRPIYVEGSCCPEYDHCPPRDPETDSAAILHSDDKTMYLNDSPTKQEFKETSKININNLPKIQIKEVTQNKPVNNEIRIKEVTPVSTKAPTFPREVPKNSQIYDSNQTINEFNDTDAEATQESISQPPQILRVGDQLLIVKQGEIIPENSSVITPSPVFTVIGAEGLQRVEDDLEDKELVDEETTLKLKDDIPMFPVDEESKGLDEMIKESISELYVTTTKEPIDDSIDKEYTENIQIYKDTESLINNPYTDEPKTIILSTSSDNLDDDIQAVPIEHLPEHNPEYPPIPEDIMILSMTEDTLEPLSEIEFTPEGPINNLKSNNDEKIVIVKRPVIPLSIPKHAKNPNVLRDNHTPEKILPDILPLVRNNKTSNNDSLVPEEWLKERTEKPKNEVNSPLLTLDAALPESILKGNIKSSAEEDDSKEYIFVTDETVKGSEPNNNTAVDSLSDITTESFTEIPIPKQDYRSPGEPHLVPEWERNQSIYETDPSTSTQNSFIVLSDFNDTAINENGKENYTNDNEIEEDAGYPEETYFNENNLTTPKPIFNENLKVNYSYMDDFDIGEEDNMGLDESETASESITQYTSSTEKNLYSSTENNSEITSRPHIELEDFGDDQTLNSYDENIYPQKQKKASALVENKNSDSSKRHNILADLINLVGDVAAIGHETEVSTVHNSIDSKYKSDQKPYRGNNNPTIERDYIVPLDNVVSGSDPLQERSNIELTEYNASGDKIDSDIPMENDRVEFTTRKILIDKEVDDKNTWKVEEVGKDIELIPKVQKNPPKKDPSLEKIKESNMKSQNPSSKINEVAVTKDKIKEEDVIIYTTVHVNPLSQEISTPAPNKTKIKINDFPETLITVEADSKGLEKKNNPKPNTTEKSLVNAKVSGKINIDESSMSQDEGDKLAKREASPEAKEAIDDKYLDVLKNYFERRFIH